MSQPPGGSCRFFNSPRGCRFRERCKFTHDRDTSASPRASPLPTQLSTPTQSRRQGTPAASRAPRQVCDFFWTTGQCARGFECNFRHERQHGAGPAQDQPATAPSEEQAADFFSAEGLAINIGSVREERHTLNPSEVHNHLKEFLRDNYTFESASKVQGFVRILGSVNDRNKAWNTEDAQALLEVIVKGNILLRIGDVLRFEPVDFRVSYGSGALSFQRGYFPVFQFFASDLILKTTLHKHINHLYTVLENNHEVVFNVIQICMAAMIENNSWKDPTPGLLPSLQNNLDGVTVFKVLSTIILQYLNRFKDSVRNHPNIVELVNKFSSWFELWEKAVSTSPPRFDDVITSSPHNTRILIIGQLREEIDRLKAIVQRESDALRKLTRASARPMVTPAQRSEALMGQLVQTYDPPGTLRMAGPRHDNDFEDISKIRIAPSHNELLSPLPPYLPVFLPNAPHHRPANSMERHVDIQFRLLREELISTTRSSITAIHDDLTTMSKGSRKKKDRTKLEELIDKRGGAYRTSGYDSVFFQVYTNVNFGSVRAERRAITVGLQLDAPPGAPRDPSSKKRAEYWEHSKRLQGGNLVALVLIKPQTLRIFLGVITSSGKDIVESSKRHESRLEVRVSFFDAEVELMALREEHISSSKSTFAILVDNGVMLESVRPFLERLQTIEPMEIPFVRYIAQNASLVDLQILPPRYATAPRFCFKLQCLAKPGQLISDLNISQPNAVTIAHRQLLRSSELDSSQVDALLAALTKEVALIQGPPGTGKSFTGKEILRVLFSSGIKPIVLIAYTNHAVDHMLTSILDAKVTEKIVRLGSRSSDERIAQYTLDNLDKIAAASSLDRSMKRQYAIMKQLEEDTVQVMDSIQLPLLTWDKVEEHLDIHFPDHAESLREPPYWIAAYAERVWADEEVNGDWTTVKKKAQNADSQMDRTFYGFWKDGQDIQLIQPPPKPKPPKMPQSKDRRQQVEMPVTPSLDPFVFQFFAGLGFGTAIPRIPMTSRSLESLLEVSAVWSMSLQERRRLAAEWERRIRGMAYNSHLQHYEALCTRYKEVCDEYNDMKDESRRRLLSNTDLIACTTTGAAKVTSLLNSVAPKVLVVEEAGQVLEAHILTSLVPSVRHLICIGDPQQLRPSLATYALSMDSERGNALFKFDRSLMERLSDSGLSMSQINEQRRMRPAISHFIRQILYPALKDHDVVLHYPSVQGMQNDVYFFDHTNKENDSDDTVSKYNTFEVEMIRDLVLYFLKQGVYNGAGDIAVLCAYLGQLQRVRAALRDLKIAVAVDERDEEQLARQGITDEVEFEEVVVAKHVRLGTVDIFQGQEAKIVIVSLVRNSGTHETGSASIGFLKSSNRINVALSRAKHGLYILGNASNLRTNPTWSIIVDELEARNQMGYGLPIICPRHPDQKQFITQPGELGRFAPGGGCLLPCGFRLMCGHTCPSSCHAALDNHRTMKCYMPCNRTPCSRNHPCSKRCSDECGDCEFPMYRVMLPCGHEAEKLPCYMLEQLAAFQCKEQVKKQLPGCEHSAMVPCHQDPASYECRELCRGTMGCCSKSCKSRCHDCQKASSASMTPVTTRIQRTHHVAHPCDRHLYCQHTCGLDCSQDHICNTACKQGCRQRCIHHECVQPCWQPCAPCMEPCPWSCAHHSCPVLCGSICVRLPCDEPCSNVLQCGHPCPSVCGEPCSTQRCVDCLPSDRKEDIVDFIMQRRLSDIDLSSADISERLIRLECGHTFTVETLDGHCGMGDYYEIDQIGRFISPKAPPITFQSPPTCPTCRGPITSLRHGRITKRATLDILEQNVASTMSHDLDSLTPQVEELTLTLKDTQELAKKLPENLNGMLPRPASADTIASGNPSEPLGVNRLDMHAMQTLHGIAPDEATAWCTMIKDYLAIHRRIYRIATTRGAHVKAYEAALATLFRLEMDSIANDPTRASEAPEPVAMRIVDQKIGQPPHKADTCFQIEAYFLLLELRSMLGQVAFSRLQGLSTSVNQSGSDADVDITPVLRRRHRDLWQSFVDFLYDSCIADAKKAFTIAEKSSASRQTARSAIYILRFQFEQFRFQVLFERENLLKARLLTEDRRNTLARQINARKLEMLTLLFQIQRDYIRCRPSRNTEDLKNERKWVDENCRQKVEHWRSECDELEKYVLTDGIFYEPLSLQEKSDIVKAFNFSHRGHFYNCENGHTFVIGECGGAMQASRCPECHAPVGGNQHTLISSNARAAEYEAIAGGQGSLPGVFNWTRGA